MEFLHNAMQIEIYTRQKCKKFPKSERFTTCAALIALAREVRGLLARGNEIYPTNQHEAQLRRDCFIKAKSVCADFVQEIEICCRACGINMDTTIRCSCSAEYPAAAGKHEGLVHAAIYLRRRNRP